MAAKARVFLTGDTHGPVDSGRIIGPHAKLDRFSSKDSLIILGDFGGVWYGNWKDEYLLNAYEQLPCNIYFIDGNHENFDALEKYPEYTVSGARCHVLRNNLFHVKRGEVLTLDGKKFFCFGGARSIDKVYRTEGTSWWSREEPSMSEYENAENNLDAVGWKVDYVLTHCAPTLTLRRLFPRAIDDPQTDRFEEWDYQLDCKHWYFGHYHIDQKIDDRHTCLYTKIERVK